MKKIAIITEDICSLPEKEIKNYGIEIVKTKLYFSQLERFPEKNIYQLMEETKELPKTSAPSPGDYLRAYKKVLENFEKALVITTSSKLSGCFNSAFEAKQLFDFPERIFLFDSQQAVVGQGLLVLKAAQLIDQEKDIEEIFKILEGLRSKIKTFGFLKTTYWAKMTGRLSKRLDFAFWILRILGIYPYFGIKEGKIGFSGFNFWTSDNERSIFNQLKHASKKGEMVVGINYTNNLELALKLKEKIEKELKSQVLFCSLVPPIVGVNSGPGTLIVGFYYC
jgi:DegV family protein with EDD domain